MQPGPALIMGARVTPNDVLNSPTALEQLGLPQELWTVVASYGMRGVNTTDDFTGIVWQDNMVLMQAAQQTQNQWPHPNQGEQYPYPAKMSEVAAQFNAALALVETMLPGTP